MKKELFLVATIAISGIICFFLFQATFEAFFSSEEWPFYKYLFFDMIVFSIFVISVLSLIDLFVHSDSIIIKILRKALLRIRFRRH